MTRSGILLITLLILPAALLRADWLSFSFDPQRTAWNRDEKKLSRENVKNLAVEWKLRLDNQARELNSLTAAVVIENVFTPRGVKDIVIVAGSSDTIFAVDADSGKLIWSKQFQPEGAPKNPPHWLCPNALNATPVIAKKGSFDKSVYTIASDGKLHALNVINGEDRFPPTQFVPAFSKNWSLNLVDGFLVTTVSQGCNGAKSGLYSMNLNDASHPVAFFQSAPAGGGIWGRAGAAVSPELGLAFGETGDGPHDAAAGKLTDSVLAASYKDMKLAGRYTPANRDWITKKDLDMGNMSPVIFPFEQWTLVAGAGKEGLIYLLDAKKPGGENSRTPLFRSPLYANEDVDFSGRGFWGAMATAADDAGARWLFAPAHGPRHSQSPAFPLTHGEAPNGSIMAFKVQLQEGKPALTPAWQSRDLDVPEPPAVANGVVFAVSSGENSRQVDSQGKLMNAKQRAETPRGKAVLYALDASTGKELYSSGPLSSFTHFSGIAVAAGRIYVTTFDGTLYCFGLRQN